MSEPKPLDLEDFTIWIKNKQKEMYKKEGVIDTDKLNELIIDEIKQRIRAASEFYFQELNKIENDTKIRISDEREGGIKAFSGICMDEVRKAFRIAFKNVLGVEVDE
ncbi:MAG: hypothetical protein DRI61_04500 [Chloroflexi bacterium]|nr:MAG: hypothetical protein DRI61_04500 [Chloroflexota bacterium]